MTPPPNRQLTDAIMSALGSRPDWVVEAAAGFLVTTPWFAPRWEQLQTLLEGRSDKTRGEMVKALMAMGLSVAGTGLAVTFSASDDKVVGNDLKIDEPTIFEITKERIIRSAKGIYI